MNKYEYFFRKYIQLISIPEKLFTNCTFANINHTSWMDKYYLSNIENIRSRPWNSVWMEHCKGRKCVRCVGVWKWTLSMVGVELWWSDCLVLLCIQLLLAQFYSSIVNILFVYKFHISLTFGLLFIAPLMGLEGPLSS